MATTYRIAVIGELGVRHGLSGPGTETYPVTAPGGGPGTIRELAKSGDCGIIYLTEQLADLPDVRWTGIRTSCPRHHPDPRQGRVPWHRYGQHPAVRSEAVGADIL